MKQLIKKFYFPSGSSRKVFFGPYRGLVFNISNKRDRISIFYKYYEKEISLYLKSIIKQNMQIIDVGAHYGIHVLFIWKLMKGTGNIYAFEPWEENYNLLSKNIESNNAKNIIAVPKAVSSSVKKVRLVEGSGTGEHHIGEVGNESLNSTETVILDNFFVMYNIIPNLILIDVEGHETEVLIGGSKSIKKSKPILIIEHHNQVEKVVHKIKELGYSKYKNMGRHIITLNE